MLAYWLTACAVAAGPVRVFFVPHSHEDPGWTQTIDEYYNGYDATHYGVKAIYDSVTAELAVHPHRRFLSVEMLFFSRWWGDPNTTDAQRATWRRLLARGQVEFATGGWVMHDEIASMYDADINQMTLGHRWIADTFGEVHVPQHAWHIDEQGHVGATAALFARMGFETLTPNRVPQPVKDRMQAQRGLAFEWDGLGGAVTAQGQSGTILTQLLDFYGYCCPNVPRHTYYWDDYTYWGKGGGGRR
eukprot:g6928.t1